MSETRVQTMIEASEQLDELRMNQVKQGETSDALRATTDALFTDLKKMIAELRPRGFDPQKQPMIQSPSTSTIYTANHHSPLTPKTPSPPPDPPDFNQFGQRLSKFEFPKFDGTLLRDWFRRCDEYFYFHRTPPEMRVRVVSPHMIGKALQWHTNYIRNNFGMFPPWLDYIIAISAKFGGDDTLPMPRAPFSPYQIPNNQSHYKSPNTTSLLPPPETTKTLPYKPNFPTETNMEKFSYAEMQERRTEESGVVIIEETVVVKSPTISDNALSGLTFNSKELDCGLVLEMECDDDQVSDVKEDAHQIEKTVVMKNDHPVLQISTSVYDMLPAQKVDLSVKEVEVTPQKSTSINDKNIEHQLFDEIPLRLVSKEKRRKCLKAWKFKFKTNSKRRKSMSDEFSLMEKTILFNKDPKEIMWHCVNKEFEETMAARGMKRIERFKLNDNKTSKPADYDVTIQVPLSSLEPSRRYHQGSPVVVNDLSFNLECVIGKTNECICDPELGQAISLDAEEFKWFTFGKLSKSERCLSSVCLVGLMDMSCWTQLLKQQICPKSWSFKYRYKARTRVMKTTKQLHTPLSCPVLLLEGDLNLTLELFVLLKHEFNEECGVLSLEKELGAGVRVIKQDSRGMQQLRCGVVNFYLKHKWRSKLLKSFSGLRFYMDNSCVFVRVEWLMMQQMSFYTQWKRFLHISMVIKESPNDASESDYQEESLIADKFFEENSHIIRLFLKLNLRYKTGFWTQYKDLKQLSTELQSSPGLVCFIYLLSIWNQSLKYGCEADRISSGTFSIDAVHGFFTCSKLQTGDEIQGKILLVLNEISLLENNNRIEFTAKETWVYKKPMLRGVFHLQRPPELIDRHGYPNFITKVLVEWKEHPPDQFSHTFSSSGKFLVFHYP